MGNHYRNKIFNSTETETGIDAAKTACKRFVQKTAEATWDLIENKKADKITSLGKTKSKEKEDKIQEIYIPPEKRQQINVLPKNHKLIRYSAWWSAQIYC